MGSWDWADLRKEEAQMRLSAHSPATREQTLKPLRLDCPGCGRRMWTRYTSYRVVTTLTDRLGLYLKVYHCPDPGCPRYRRSYRPEAEGALVLPQHEFGLDVIAAIGALRYVEHRSVPEIHQRLRARGVDIAERTVTHLLHRYDELLALSLSDPARLRALTAKQRRVILALDGLQPDVGHEVLWVLRDCLSGEVLLAKSLLSATAQDLGALLRSVAEVLGVPIVAVLSDGQHSIRKAVRETLPGVPYQLCHFHYLREAALPVYEADRHAKKELKKRVRGIRPLERKVEGRSDAEAEVVRGYCAAVRSALTDDGRTSAGGLGVEAARPTQRHRAEPEPGRKGGGLPRPLARLRGLIRNGLEQTADLWPDVRVAFAWVHRAAHPISVDTTSTPLRRTRRGCPKRRSACGPRRNAPPRPERLRTRSPPLLRSVPPPSARSNTKPPAHPFGMLIPRLFCAWCQTRTNQDLLRLPHRRDHTPVAVLHILR